jgi:hypothetical protein
MRFQRQLLSEQQQSQSVANGPAKDEPEAPRGAQRCEACSCPTTLRTVTTSGGRALAGQTTVTVKTRRGASGSGRESMVNGSKRADVWPQAQQASTDLWNAGRGRCGTVSVLLLLLLLLSNAYLNCPVKSAVTMLRSRRT